MNESFAGEEGKRKWRSLFNKPLTPEEEEENAQESRERLPLARQFVADRLGENPTQERLLAMCAELQSELWESRQMTRLLLGLLGKTTVTGDTMIENLEENLENAIHESELKETHPPPKRLSLAKVARQISQTQAAIKKAVLELRKLDKTDPQIEKRIQAERYQPLTARDVQNVKAHLATKHQRPKARSKMRQKGTKSKGVTKGS